MAFVIGTRAELDAFNAAVNQAEGLPNGPTLRYYDDPFETVDERLAVRAVEERHLPLAAGLTVEENVVLKIDVE